MNPPTESDSHPAAAAHIKLPTFSAIEAPIWFRRAEIQFRLKKITHTTSKADHVLAALPDDLFPRIAEWLESKGDTAVKYEDLKAFLLQRFTPSPAQRTAQLLQLAKQPLGDQKPSEALLEMKALARLPPAPNGQTRTVDLLRALWLLRLPEPIRAAIPNAEEISEDDLQLQADNLMDAHAASARHILAVPTGPPPSPREDTVEVAAAHHPPPTTRQGSKQRYHATRPHNSRDKRNFSDQLCFYHARFGPRAKKCEAGCGWPKNE